MDQLNSFNQHQQGNGRSFTPPNAGSLPSMNSLEEGLCLVCNDVSTGYHYGCPSCNGCKTFFRRTIMKKQTFKCQYNENCPVDKSVRCACRHCRFKKCLAAGMKSDAIQQNRDPIGYTKRTRRYPVVKNEPNAPLKGSVDIEVMEHKYAGMMVGATKLERGGVSSADHHLSLQLSPQHSVVDLSPERVAEDTLMRSLMEIEKRIATLRNSQAKLEKSLVDMVMQPSVFLDGDFMRRQSESSVHSVGALRRAQHEDYQYWHHRDWLIMIEWAKTIPVYQRLPLNDKAATLASVHGRHYPTPFQIQLALLRHSAITHPSLLQCFYTPDCGPDTIVFPNGAFFDRSHEQDRPAGLQRKKFKMLDNLLGPMRKMQIDANEFAAAKAIFFLNPDADDLSMDVRTPINECRGAIINALYRYMVEKHGRMAAVDRFGKLLLLGTVIATLAVEAKEAVVVADFFEQVHFTSFAKQILFGAYYHTVLFVYYYYEFLNTITQLSKASLFISTGVGSKCVKNTALETVMSPRHGANLALLQFGLETHRRGETLLNPHVDVEQLLLDHRLPPVGPGQIGVRISHAFQALSRVNAEHDLCLVWTGHRGEAIG